MGRRLTDTVVRDMYRFLLRPKWIAFHLLVIAAIITMLLLASWQWTKHNARDDFVHTVTTRAEAEPQDLSALLATMTDPADIEYYRATATGHYVAGDQLVQINQSQDGASGVNVITPFQIDGGEIVVVNRGFVAEEATVGPPPSGTMVVGGTVRSSQARRTGELTDNQGGHPNEVRRVELPVIEQRVGYSVAPVYLDLIATDPASPQPPTPAPPPDLSGGPPHLSYTIQWCIFSVAVAAGWVIAVKRSVRAARRAQHQAKPSV